MNWTISVLMSFGLLIASPGGQAALMIEGNFSGEFDAGPITTLSASFTATFDDSAVSGEPLQIFEDIPLTSLTITPNTIGTTVFGVDNVGLKLIFQSGVLDLAYLGGLLNGVDTLDTSTDDFIASFRGGQSLGLVYSVASEANRGRQPVELAGRLLASTVPSPATFALFTLGLAGMPLVRRRVVPIA